MRVIEDFLTKKEQRASRDILVLLAVFGILFFLFLGRFPLSDPDEARYAEIPREMLELRDFTTPRLNYVEYFEKPPLLYWLNALSFTLFGQNEFGARFPSALCGLLGVLLTYHIGRKLFSRKAAVFSALALGSAVGYLGLGRVNITDTLLTLCLAAALGFFLIASRESEPRPGLYFHLSYAAAAFAVLAKGLIGIVLPGAVIAAHLVLTGRLRLLGKMRLATGIPLFLLIAAPWFVLVSLKSPGFARFFFVHEHFQRYLTAAHGRCQPWWFFVPVLLGAMLPWSLFFPATARVLKGQWRTGDRAPLLFLLLWASIIFVFFSFSHSKLVPYILPVFPAAALLLGRAFSAITDEGAGAAWPERPVAALSLCILGLGIALYPHLARDSRVDITEGAFIGGLLTGQGLLVMTVLRRSKIVTLIAAFAVLSCILGVTAPLLVMEDLAELKSTKGLALFVRSTAPPDAVVASFGHYEQSFSFYARRRVILVDERGELDFGGAQGENAAWFMDTARFAMLWGSTRPVYVLMKASSLTWFRSLMKPPGRLLLNGGEAILLSNR